MKKVFYIIYQIFLHLIALTILAVGIVGIIWTSSIVPPSAIQQITQALYYIIFGSAVGFGFISLCILSKK